MSTAVATETRRYTPEDLLAMPDGKSYELVRGRLVERNMGAESSEVGGNLLTLLHLFCREHRLGIVWGADNGYQCFLHAPGLVRKPDVSFIRRGRLPGDVSPEGWVKIPPDLAVEVVSPGDSAEKLEEKLDDFKKAGVPLIWVIYPKLRKARVIRPDGPSAELGEDDVLSGEDVIPGFRCPLQEILPRRTQAEETSAGLAEPNGPSLE
ncbi:MAG: Uma2 family endonuclease [Isosphaeraceae bacterium]